MSIYLCMWREILFLSGFYESRQLYVSSYLFGVSICLFGIFILLSSVLVDGEGISMLLF